MVKERVRLHRQFLWTIDCTTVVVCFVMAYYIRTSLLAGLLPQPRSLLAYLPLLVLAVPIWSVLLHYLGGYRPLRTTRVPEVLWLVVRVTIAGLVLLSWLIFVLQLQFVSRTFVATFGVMSFVGLAVERVVLLLLFRELLRRSSNYWHVLIAGTGPRAREFGDSLDEQRELGVRIIGYLDQERDRVGCRMNGHRVVGTLDDLPRIATERVVDEVVFVVPRSWLPHLDRSMATLDELGIKATVALDLFDLPVSRSRLGETFGVPTLTYSPIPFPRGEMVVKRVLDRVVAAVLLVLTAPLFAGIALAIRLTSRGPVFFRQMRVGLHGRQFLMLKFRSMAENAEARQQELVALNEMSGPVFKITHDPRVTTVGRWLRRISLDELPQLINVLRGEMSLVGPRPPRPHEVQQYKQWQRRRLSMPPGLTCLWQVSGRNHVDFDTWMRLDLAYIDNWSLALDFKILARTVPAVLTGRGAS